MCAQRDVAADTTKPSESTEYCSLELPGMECTDAKEPNDTQAAAVAASGTVTDLRICAADEDWFSSAAGGTVRIEFTHSNGDLDLEAYDASGSKVGSSTSTNDSEEVTVPAGGSVRVFGYNGAKNSYTLTAP